MLGKKIQIVLTLLVMVMLPTAALASQWVASKVSQPARLCGVSHHGTK